MPKTHHAQYPIFLLRNEIRIRIYQIILIRTDDARIIRDNSASWQAMSFSRISVCGDVAVWAAPVYDFREAARRDCIGIPSLSASEVPCAGAQARMLRTVI
jgi:hypothetical protein